MATTAAIPGTEIMTPRQLADYLRALVKADIYSAAMIWGPPGIGKSAIVAAVAAERGLDCTDVRLSQLAPTDLRGLPVADGEVANWLPPGFLPREGRGVLFLDEINMAAPAMQGMAQQLILDRKVGSYVVPAGWHIWAAGNRKEDRAAVSDMPMPLANRFLHLHVGPELDSFREYGARKGISEQILAFVSARTNMLHMPLANSPAWPSPRSWELASRLLAAGLAIAPAVGQGAAVEFATYIEVFGKLPDVAAILAGKGEGIPFPTDPDVRWATVTALSSRAAKDPKLGLAAVRWAEARGQKEWLNRLIGDLCAAYAGAPALRKEWVRMASLEQAIWQWLRINAQYNIT